MDRPQKFPLDFLEVSLQLGSPLNNFSLEPLLGALGPKMMQQQKKKPQQQQHHHHHQHRGSGDFEPRAFELFICSAGLLAG
mmetsp:Transcript_80447/g.167597  ORF Transcript_80447/g.167597 Transcript_80447/m.167597 type:complete len:81 (+) Transcript_80447:3862-4104(+)